VLVNFNENYITVFATNFSYPLQCFYLLNYKIWGMLQDQNQGRPRATKTLVDEWDKQDQRLIDKAIGEWRKRLWAWVVAAEGQFEHKMW